jgi:DNA end-binding protein Ku
MEKDMAKKRAPKNESTPRRALWSGVLSFGLVAIPVRMVTALRDREGLAMHLLHGKDGGRIQNEHFCAIEGKKVPWDEIVHGYELAKDRYAVVTDEELTQLRPKSTQEIAIEQFVSAHEIDPVLYDRAYYLEPDAKGRRAYALLLDTLLEEGKVGVARVVLRTREHLAALMPRERALVLLLLHFAEDVLPLANVDPARGADGVKPAEKKAARMLVDAMTEPFDARDYKDTYAAELRKLLAAREKGAPPPRPVAPPAATNVIDLASMLEKSLASTRSKGRPARRAAR